MTLGTAVFGAGVALSVTWLISVKQAKPSEAFFQWPGWLGVGLLILGAICLLVGFFKPDRDPPSQTGSNSVAQSINTGDIDSGGGDVDISQRSDRR